jgi:DNA-directed RNA polymerase subunit RPC12/RpoP
MADDEDALLECRTCGREFSAPPPAAAEPEGPMVLGNVIVYSCPHCGAEATYQAGEFRFAD